MKFNAVYLSAVLVAAVAAQESGLDMPELDNPAIKKALAEAAKSDPSAKACDTMFTQAMDCNKKYIEKSKAGKVDEAQFAEECFCKDPQAMSKTVDECAKYAKGFDTKALGIDLDDLKGICAKAPTKPASSAATSSSPCSTSMSSQTPATATPVTPGKSSLTTVPTYVPKPNINSTKPGNNTGSSKPETPSPVAVNGAYAATANSLQRLGMIVGSIAAAGLFLL